MLTLGVDLAPPRAGDPPYTVQDLSVRQVADSNLAWCVNHRAAAMTALIFENSSTLSASLPTGDMSMLPPPFAVAVMQVALLIDAYRASGAPVTIHGQACVVTAEELPEAELGKALRGVRVKFKPSSVMKLPDAAGWMLPEHRYQPEDMLVRAVAGAVLTQAVDAPADSVTLIVTREGVHRQHKPPGLFTSPTPVDELPAHLGDAVALHLLQSFLEPKRVMLQRRVRRLSATQVAPDRARGITGGVRVAIKRG